MSDPMMFTAVATDGLENIEYYNSLDLRHLIEKCQEAHEVYGCEVWIENVMRETIWEPDADEATQESFDLVMGG